MQTQSLKKFIFLSIAAALATICLSYLHGSHRFSWFIFPMPSSHVLICCCHNSFGYDHFSRKPPDKEHEFGHNKAEYFFKCDEGGLIVLAAFSIIWSAVPRILHRQPLENLGIGLLVAVGASMINLVASIILV